MSEETANLSLPYILPSQAQKHVTHNEALQRLDAIVQLTIEAELATPPELPAEGCCYLIGASATGPWSGKSGRIAFRQDGAWLYLTPLDGWRAFFLADDRLRIHQAGAWHEPALPAEGSFATLGISTGADAFNRLAVSSPASLFNHAGNGHQLKINKAGAADTASLLFQSAWSGRAEMGLAGNDEFAIKVSADGSDWRTALSVSGGGIASMPNRPAVRASLAAATLSPANGSQTGFNDLHISQGGFALGTAVAGGTGNNLVVPAAGIYLLALSVSALSSSGHGVTVLANGATTLATVTAPSASTATRQSAIGLAFLDAGNRISLRHSGSGSIEFGSGKTEITLIRL
ncbi:DUF2793 domain-containing protein [Rhizobium sp. BK251]|uniref:DUF2793 domain-containing protein n=1 Tax=Rhizobium sp. BK251 TaxID=2512125 RepID=UPI0010450055|nr:DUF2793 domain-containing protein [Rhizobium sp. BK251]TCL74466.1 uncharacterized protein DUF2793 [Rhizobium sp. BK251]